jgi:hypothetical protein
MVALAAGGDVGWGYFMIERYTSSGLVRSYYEKDALPERKVPVSSLRRW